MNTTTLSHEPTALQSQQMSATGSNFVSKSVNFSSIRDYSQEMTKIKAENDKLKQTVEYLEA